MGGPARRASGLGGEDGAVVDEPEIGRTIHQGMGVGLPVLGPLGGQSQNAVRSSSLVVAMRMVQSAAGSAIFRPRTGRFRWSTPRPTSARRSGRPTGRRARSPPARLRARLFEARHLGAIRPERHRLGNSDGVRDKPDPPQPGPYPPEPHPVIPSTLSAYQAQSRATS